MSGASDSAARGLTKQALTRTCQLSSIYISQIEKAERIPSVSACSALATALGCPPKLLVLRAFRATAPEELKEMLQDESVAAPDDPVMQELAPLVATVQTLPSVTRNQLMGLWQATLLLVVGCNTDPHEVQAHNDTDVSTLSS